MQTETESSMNNLVKIYTFKVMKAGSETEYDEFEVLAWSWDLASVILRRWYPAVKCRHCYQGDVKPFDPGSKKYEVVLRRTMECKKQVAAPNEEFATMLAVLEGLQMHTVEFERADSIDTAASCVRYFEDED